jgi:hypothetical protein
MLTPIVPLQGDARPIGFGDSGLVRFVFGPTNPGADAFLDSVPVIRFAASVVSRDCVTLSFSRRLPRVLKSQTG